MTALAAATAVSGVGSASSPPVVQEGLVNLNLTGVTAQLPIDLAANLCDVTVDVLVSELDDGSAPCDASSNADAVVATEDGGPVAQAGLVNVNVTDVVVQAPISVVANVCDVTVAVLVSRLADGASPCDATGTADAITATESGAPAEPVEQEGLVNLNLTGVTVQLPIALAADLCDVTVDVLVNELDDGSAPCEASSNSNAVVATQDGGPVAQDGLVNVNVTDVVVQAPIAIAANVCDVTVAVLVSRLADGASPCDAAAAAEAITPEGSLPALPTDSIVGELPIDSVVGELPVDSVVDALPDVSAPELPVSLPAG
jgi:hypothetical protein